jgi:hypothetical protein
MCLLYNISQAERSKPLTRVSGAGNCGVPHQPYTALLFLLASSCFYPWKEDAKKNRETKGCLPVYSGCSMKDEVPKQRNYDANDQGYSEHDRKINEISFYVHFSIS